MRQQPRVDSTEAKLVDARAIDQEALFGSIEPRGARGLTAESVPGDLADDAVTAERPIDRTFPDARVPHQQCAPVVQDAPKGSDLAALGVNRDAWILQSRVEIDQTA